MNLTISATNALITAIEEHGRPIKVEANATECIETANNINSMNKMLNNLINLIDKEWHAGISTPAKEAIEFKINLCKLEIHNKQERQKMRKPKMITKKNKNIINKKLKN